MGLCAEPQVFNLRHSLKGDRAMLGHVFVVLNVCLFLQNTRKVGTGSAIFSLYPSIICCLRSGTIDTIQLEIKFSLHVALNSHLL